MNVTLGKRMKPPLGYLGSHRDHEVARLTLIAEKTKEGHYNLEYFLQEDIGKNGHVAASVLGEMVSGIELDFQKKLSQREEN